MISPDPNKLTKLVWLAGQAVLEVYHRGHFAVTSKTDLSPVAEADTYSHQVLAEGLREIAEVPMVSEESEALPWSLRREWHEYWLVDPLDGTREFIKGSGEFTINVALIRDGDPVFGIVYVPVTDEFFYGAPGVGAFYQQGVAGRPKPILCADLPSGEGLWRVLGSRSYRSEQLTELLSRLPHYQLIPVGSSLKFCLIAAGEADLYPRFGPTSEWDTAAAQAVLEAAGGQVLDWHRLTPLRYNTKESLLNPPFIACSGVSPIWQGVLCRP